jgi:hypothetical protein
MNTLRRLCVASVFALALSLPASGGEITTMVVQPPTSSLAAADGEISTGAPGEIHTGAPGEMMTPPGEAAAALLGLLQAALSLL